MYAVTGLFMFCASYCLVKDREAWPAAVHGVVKELDTTEQLKNRDTACLVSQVHYFLVWPYMLSFHVLICLLFVTWLMH